MYASICDKQDVELFLYHSISENGQALFWFLTLEERTLFKELIKISWVWWRVAQNILSLWASRLKIAILEDDKKTIESIKWVGKKMAEKIVLELWDKDIVKNFQPEIITQKKQNNSHIEKDMKNEILSTLILMWYNGKKVEDMFEKLPQWVDTIEKILPYIIKNI